MKVYLDAGHGGSDSGALGNGLQEKEVTLDIAKRIDTLLQDYTNVKVKMSRTRDVTKSLRERTNEANNWGADIYLSIHCNAFNGKVRGYEDFIYNKLTKNALARSYQVKLHQAITKRIDLPNRGMKQANFHVLRETSMPAVLSENGFIDHPLDATLMKQAAWKDAVAGGHVDGLVNIFQLKKKTDIKNVYAVFAGSFEKRTNAEAQVLLLKAKGFPGRVFPFVLENKTLYRVRAGAYGNRHAAEAQKQRLLVKGMESFIDISTK